MRRSGARPTVRACGALLFEAPCVALPGKRGTMRVDADKCVGCHRCIRELGCPALSVGEGRQGRDSARYVHCVRTVRAGVPGELHCGGEVT